MKTVEMSIDRQYVYLFDWVRGIDAQSLVKAGALSAPEASALVANVVEDLAAKGFRVLVDSKPGAAGATRRNSAATAEYPTESQRETRTFASDKRA